MDPIPRVAEANLGRAMTIHKSQGQTIDRLKVGAKRIFESGTCGIVGAGLCLCCGCAQLETRDQRRGR